MAAVFTSPDCTVALPFASGALWGSAPWSACPLAKAAMGPAIIDAPIARVVRTPTVALMRLLFLVIVMPPYASSTVNRKLVSYWHTRKSPSGVMLVVRILST